MFRKTVLLIGLAMIVSCASDTPSVKILKKYAETNTSTQKGGDSYIISPGDVLSIDVWKEPQLSKQISVRLDGMISLPLVHEIPAAGLTCVELRNYLMKKYQDFLDVPEVSVTVVQSSKKIYILGEVISPGEYQLTKNLTILQAISQAGGLTEWGDKSNIRLIRKIGGKEKHYRFDYDAVVYGEDPDQNILLKPDDTIFVP